MSTNQSQHSLSRRRLLLSAIGGAAGVTLGQRLGFAQEGGGKKYALLVGVKNYDPSILKPLEYSEQDMISMGEALVALGFDVVVMTSQQEIPTRVPMMPEDIITQLDRRLRDRRKEDLVLISLSGHGVQLKSDAVLADGSKETYFCPQRADLRDRKTLLPLSEVIRRMESSEAGRKLLLVDACRDEVEPPEVINKTVEIELDPVGPRRRRKPEGMAALFSCSPGERSFELRQLGHSAFTYHVLRYLRGQCDPGEYPNRELSISRLTSYVSRETRDYISQQLDKDQFPQMIGSSNEWSLGRLSADPNAVVRGRVAGEVREWVPSLGMKFAWCPAGSFQMGSPLSEVGRDDDELQHTVRLSEGFWLGQTEVTRGQFSRFVSATGYRTEGERDGEGGYGIDSEGNYSQKPEYTWRTAGFSQTDDHPVVNVSWNDAVAFIEWLSLVEGKRFRLPTESEWEYACRAGTTSAYYNGNAPEGLTKVGNVADSTAKQRFPSWTTVGTSDGYVYTSPVGVFSANVWNLHDMHGNVWEWCSDWYGDYAAGTATDPVGASSGSNRVLRGGGWSFQASYCRAADRLRGGPSDRSSYLGFRLLLSPSVK
jgi:formylglycine-generating enzyme required for sulfatase activity